MHPFLKRLASATLLSMAALAAGPASAADYPARPVTIIVPFPPGSISDLSIRLIAAKMTQDLGQTVVVENKGGAGGIVGTTIVAHAKPDGYTLLLGTNSTNAINPSLYKTLPYNAQKDFKPITMTGVIPAIIVARKTLPANNAKELIALAKSKPGMLRIAVGSTTSRVASEALQIDAGIKMITVPYRGEPPGLTDLLGGQVDLMSLNLPTALPQLKQGNIKPIGFVGANRISLLPDVPRIGETVKSYTIPTGWNAIFAPAGTSDAIVKKLNEVIVAALKDPDVKTKLEATGGYIVTPTTPQELGKWVEQDTKTWAHLIKETGIPLL